MRFESNYASTNYNKNEFGVLVICSFFILFSSCQKKETRTVNELRIDFCEREENKIRYFRFCCVRVRLQAYKAVFFNQSRQDEQ